MAKVTNEMRYRTAEERVRAFGEFCKKQGEDCKSCPYDEIENDDERFANCVIGFAHWLALEAEPEKPEPCPFCGGKCNVIGDVNHRVKCTSCNYESIMDSDRDKVVSAHNRVCRAARDVKLAHETMNKIENSTIGFCNYEKETIMNILKRYREASYSVRAAKESEVK